MAKRAPAPAAAPKEADPETVAAAPGSVHVEARYPSLRVALDKADYRQYPCSAAQQPQGAHPPHSSLALYRDLEFDKSEGGGGVCCEAPTFYVWRDPVNQAFWIRFYQASMRSRTDLWFGPFVIGDCASPELDCSRAKTWSPPTGASGPPS